MVKVAGGPVLTSESQEDGKNGGARDTVELFRPTGPRELALVAQSGYTRWPPRLHGQPIFYPVLNEEYAAHIAQEWNATKPEHEYTGFVTRFRVRRSFIQRYEAHRVGGHIHEEYWIPAEDLDELNRNLVGPIEVLAQFRGGAERGCGSHGE